MFLYLRKINRMLTLQKVVMSKKTYFLMYEFHSLFLHVTDPQGLGTLLSRALSRCTCFMLFKGFARP